MAISDSFNKKAIWLFWEFCSDQLGLKLKHVELIEATILHLDQIMTRFISSKFHMWKRSMIVGKLVLMLIYHQINITF